MSSADGAIYYSFCDCEQCKSNVQWTQLVNKGISVTLTSTDNKGKAIQKDLHLTAR